MDITLMMGSNATGKSTRMRNFVDYLTEKFGEPEDYKYTFFDHKVDKTIEVVLGLLYPNGHFVLGSKTGTKAGWSSMDKAILSTQGLRTEFYKWAMDNDERIKHIFAEGYFNMCCVKSLPKYLQENRIREC